MIEIHPFLSFVPKNSRYLLLGSFPGKEPGDWFYGTKRTQFWIILEAVYGRKLHTKAQKEKLFTELKLAISDVIYSAERKNNNNLDNNLINIIFNTTVIGQILRKNKISKIYFTSRFVEKIYRTKFKDLIIKYPNISKACPSGIKIVTLPSPSPRFAAMTKEEKIRIYKKLLPLSY
jgi:G:T/U-mismatch repair DNA glycosylase